MYRAPGSVLQTPVPAHRVLQLEHEGPVGEAVFVDASGSYWVAFDAWIAGAVGYPHSRDLFIRQLGLSGATPVLSRPARCLRGWSPTDHARFVRID